MQVRKNDFEALKRRVDYLENRTWEELERENRRLLAERETVKKLEEKVRKLESFISLREKVLAGIALEAIENTKAGRYEP